MDLNDLIQTQLSKERKRRFDNSDQLSLGKLIEKVQIIANKQPARIQEGFEEARVCYDFGSLFPTCIGSWRGSYAELALDYTERGPELTVNNFLGMLKGAVGKSFEGYKGGDFLMDNNTPVWVANYGNSGSTAVIDVVDEGHIVVITTSYMKF